MKSCVIAVTGDFGALRTEAKMRCWIEANGGKFATRITPDLTHLVCSLSHYKRMVPKGQ